MTKRKNMGISEAIKIAGGQHQLAAAIGVRQPCIHYYLYENCPAEKAVAIEKATSVSKEKIRPDIFKPQGKNKIGTRKN